MSTVARLRSRQLSSADRSRDMAHGALARSGAARERLPERTRAPAHAFRTTVLARSSAGALSVHRRSPRSHARVSGIGAFSMRTHVRLAALHSSHIPCEIAHFARASVMSKPHPCAQGTYCLPALSTIVVTARMLTPFIIGAFHWRAIWCARAIHATREDGCDARLRGRRWRCYALSASSASASARVIVPYAIAVAIALIARPV